MLPPVPSPPPASPLKIRQSCVSQAYTGSSVQLVQSSVRLKFDDIAPFTLVDNCYQLQGIQFQAAIAIQPSNPLFALPAQHCALMPVGNSTRFEASFTAPVYRIDATVVGTRPVRLIAYDAVGAELGQVSSEPVSRVLTASPPSASWPQHTLELLGPAFQRFALASSAPFILSSLSLNFA